ncbi:hypothetical protein [Clostridium sp.]|uniref:hypothetical protein n=1 Tax=Clostridium sp. TaxID=1506 RepID=UPI00283BB63E|nr:hypothetical protein [Clostridium sp.]MDR3595636.1 hypothetical protein [Clostridium sp.]
MIKVPSNVLKKLCLAYQTTDADITYLGGGREDSDGIAYTYYLKDKKWFLRFLKWRSLLLFTCMQGYLDTNEQLKNGFIAKIKEPPEIFRSNLYI